MRLEFYIFVLHIGKLFVGDTLNNLCLNLLRSGHYCWHDAFRLQSYQAKKTRFLLAAPVDTRPRTSLISFCTVQLRTLCAAHSLASLCLSMTSGPDPGELPGFWGSMVFRHAPIPRKGSGNQQQENRRKVVVPTK